MNRSQSLRNKNRSGFTLVELVIVVLVLGIITAVAAPRMFDTAGDARISATRQSLSVLRSAIELSRAENGAYPADPLQTTLLPFLQGSFSAPQVGTNADDATVLASSADPLVAVTAGGEGWIYNPTTGEIRVNTTDATEFAW